MLRKIWIEQFVQQLKERRPSSSQSNQYESSPLQNPTNTCVRFLEKPMILLIHTRKFFSIYVFWIACFILNVNRASMLHGDAWNLQKVPNFHLNHSTTCKTWLNIIWLLSICEGGGREIKTFTFFFFWWLIFYYWPTTENKNATPQHDAFHAFP